MEFNERLVMLRKEKGFTREEFAAYLGISKYTLRNYELGKTEPGHVFLKYLSDVFKVSIDFLLCMTDDKSMPSKKPEFSIDEIGHIKKYRSLPDSGKETVDFILNKEYERTLISETKEPVALETTHRTYQVEGQIAARGNTHTKVSGNSQLSEKEMQSHLDSLSEDLDI